LCYEQPGAQEPTYAFKHVLLQEVAYRSLLPARRQALHAAVGQLLEARYAGQFDQTYALLAYHYAQTTQAAKTIEYLRRASEQAASHYAHVEAVASLRAALAQVEQLPAAQRDACRLDLILRQAHALFSLGRLEETQALLLQQQALLVQLQDAQLTGRYALLLGQTAQQLGHWEQAAQHAQQAIQAATSCSDEETVGQAYYVLAMERYWVGRPLEGIAYSQQAVTLLERSVAHSQLGMAYLVMGLHYLILGNFEAALEATAKAEAIGEAAEDANLQTFAAWATGWMHATGGAWDTGIAACQRGLERAPDPLNIAFALGWLGYAYLEKGHPEEAVSLLQQAIEHMRQFHYRRLEGLYTTLLGEASLAQGDADKAHELAQQGLDITSVATYQFGVGWAQRTLGKIAQRRGALSEAKQHLCVALETFAAIPARFEAGRTHLVLATVAFQQENHEAAARHITAAHRLFSGLQNLTYVERTEQQAREFGLQLAVAAVKSLENP
jgi:tetratricopeptide (TPR) repeat protein